MAFSAAGWNLATGPDTVQPATRVRSWLTDGELWLPLIPVAAAPGRRMATFRGNGIT